MSGTGSLSPSKMLIGVVMAVVVYLLLLHMPRSAIPEHLLNHAVVYRENLVSDDLGHTLMNHMKEISVFPSNIAADLKTAVAVTSNEEIGEGQPLSADGKCDHLYLTPNVNKTLCVLPQRIDVGMGFIKTGGVDGLQELHETMVSRTSSFGQYNMFSKEDSDLKKVHPAVSALFRSAKFESVSTAVCPSDKQIVDPFQYNFIINVPGQSVPLHLDAPTFRGGATRKNFPQWLLVAMCFSGFFKEHYVDNVQVVAYLHRWIPQKKHAGDFVYFRQDSSKFEMIPAMPLAGTGVDGAKTIHAARTYMPQEMVPPLDKDKHSELVYKGNEKWNLQVDGKTVRIYDTNDLRVAIVYRARCFESVEDRDDFHENGFGSKVEPYMALEKILARFKSDLVAKGKLSEEGAESISRLDLALLIISTYIQYPLPDPSVRLMPYNVCALAKIFPTVKPLMTAFCR